MMEPEVSNKEDQRLEKLFQALNEPLSDQAFVDIVMRRLSRRQRVRQITLAAAAIAGFAVSIVPAYRLIYRLSEGLAIAVARWPDFARVSDVELLALVVLLAIAWPAALRWLSR